MCFIYATRFNIYAFRTDDLPRGDYVVESWNFQTRRWVYAAKRGGVEDISKNLLVAASSIT
jgi:hypothetical protein